MAIAIQMGAPRDSGVRPTPFQPPVLRALGVSKRFGALQALAGVDLEVAKGEVHCLLGENGAGKSTLCNVIFGVHQPDTGSLALGGAEFRPHSPRDALARGVAMVHQHFSLVGNLSALDNLRLGRKLERGTEASLRERARRIASDLDFELALDERVEDLAVGQRQRLEIVKCLLSTPQLLVLDEPTAVLPPREVAGLLKICRRIAELGCGILLVTHKLAEIGAIADRVTVLRRGRSVESVRMADADLSELVRAMVGREVRDLGEPAPTRVGVANEQPALEVRDLSYRDAAGVERLQLSLSVGHGEIVGLAGVEGNGQSELAAIVSGMLAPSRGQVFIEGEDVTGKRPRELTRRGLGCVPEDRHADGCHVELSVSENLFLGQLGRFTRHGLLDRKAMQVAATERMQAFDVRGAADAKMSQLSGGNQQKAVLARELSLDPLVALVAAQPSRGLDVGAVEAVYGELRRVRERGAGVLLISSELDELLAVADRVLVIYRGRIVGERPGGRTQQHAVGLLMSGQGAELEEP